MKSIFERLIALNMDKINTSLKAFNFDKTYQEFVNEVKEVKKNVKSSQSDHVKFTYEFKPSKNYKEVSEIVELWKIPPEKSTEIIHNFLLIINFLIFVFLLKQLNFNL